MFVYPFVLAYVAKFTKILRQTSTIVDENITKFGAVSTSNIVSKEVPHSYVNTCSTSQPQASDEKVSHAVMLVERLSEGDIVVLTPILQEARSSRVRSVFCLQSGQQHSTQYGALSHDAMLGLEQGSVLRTSRDCEVYVTRASLFECIMSIASEAKARVMCFT